MMAETLLKWRVIPFHFKVDTNRQQRSRGAEEQGRKN
jgi:hypothetical protein